MFGFLIYIYIYIYILLLLKVMRQQFSDGVDKLQPLHVGSPRVVIHENLLKLIVFSSIYSKNKKGPFLLGHSVTVVRNAYSSSSSSSSRLLTHQLRSGGESAGSKQFSIREMSHSYARHRAHISSTTTKYLRTQ